MVLNPWCAVPSSGSGTSGPTTFFSYSNFCAEALDNYIHVYGDVEERRWGSPVRCAAQLRLLRKTPTFWSRRNRPAGLEISIHARGCRKSGKESVNGWRPRSYETSKNLKVERPGIRCLCCFRVNFYLCTYNVYSVHVLDSTYILFTLPLLSRTVNPV